MDVALCALGLVARLVRRDINATKRLVTDLRAGRASKAQQSTAADFVESWLTRSEREALEQAGQQRLFG